MSYMIGWRDFLSQSVADRRSCDLTDILYQRDREFIAFARPELAVSGMGSLSAAPVVDIPTTSVA
jgi:hypothetical protein